MSATPDLPPAASPAPGIETASSLTGPRPGTPGVKVVVAVHGIGEQQSFATAQSVLNRFCGFYGQPTAVPLGNFHTGEAALTLADRFPDPPFGRLAFSEVYWAQIPRKLVSEKYTVEEARKWARTIVERLRLRWVAAGRPAGGSEADFRLMEQVLGEMVQTIAVLDRLCWIADRAGVFTFDLRQLLDDFLGDVQIVTEFRTKREEILAEFRAAMDRIEAEYPDPEIYVVAHSEGTVVSLLGLTEGFARRLPWAAHVRGFMTLGSPIDKHLALWPALFEVDPPAAPPAGAAGAPRRVRWRNYYDFGDPVGFELDGARAWMRERGWDRLFEFEPQHDHGFTRYPFPGKAHVDYWDDPWVFGHFIGSVVNAPPLAWPEPEERAAVRAAREAAERSARDYAAPPRDVQRARVLSYAVPYLGIVALLALAAYVLFKAVNGAMTPPPPPGAAPDEPSVATVARWVAGMTALLLGVTVAARVPRLTRSPFWRATAAAVAALASALFLWAIPGRQLGGPWDLALTTAVVVAPLLVVVAYALGAWRPAWGLRPMILLGTASVAGIVAAYVYQVDEPGPLWPVVLATIAFLYLWWLGALLFDLTFVWHVYIRHSKLRQRIRTMTAGPEATARA